MQGAYLGVARSLTGRSWIGPAAPEERLAAALAQQTGLPPAVCAVLAARGVAPAGAAAYLRPALRDLLPDPLVLRDMGRAADRLLAALDRGERIAIFADYDVDGGASAALLIDWLQDLGRPATLYVPDRIDEGYGPNPAAMEQLGGAHDLLICVDCGTLGHEALAAARCDVIVLDHHLGAETLPPALAVVNPNRQDESGDLAHLCAAAVVFLLLVEANRRLRAAGRTGPDLMALTDLVALATVADVAPLIGVNRALVRTGLSVMARRARPGLRALADVAGLAEPPRAWHLGYLLGPRINAGGRIGQADLGARLLATRAPAEAEALARQLDALNAERRAIEAEVTREALAQAEARGFDAPLVWAAGAGWHPGVIGIVASRLKEAAQRPAVVIGTTATEAKGSGRSVPGVDLGAAVQRLAAEGLITRGGGHKMAAGLTLDPAAIGPAMARLADLLGRQGAGQDRAQDLRIDALVMGQAATVDLIAAIEEAGPYGAAAPAPRFALPALRIEHVARVGETHLRLRARDSGGTSIGAIAFGAFDGPLGPALIDTQGQVLHLAGRLEINHWNGRQSVQLRLEDAAPA